jgi:hypothetical protein
LRRTCSAPHSSVFARLASGAFYETIVPVTFYEIIKIDKFVKTLKMQLFVIPAKAGIQ